MNIHDTYGAEASSLLEELPPYEFGDMVGVFDCGDGMWQKIFTCESREKAQGYVESLNTAGYELLSMNEKGDNAFWQLKNDRKVLMVAYVPAENYLRLVAEPAESAVISGVREKGYENLYRTQITQIGLECNEEGLHNYLGRSYDVSIACVVRLCDGSFIVYDGGMPYSEHAKRL